MLNNITPFKAKFPKNIFIKFFLKLIRSLINIFLFIFFKIIKVKIINSPLEAIGHQCYDLECMFYDKDFQENKNKILVPLNKNFLGNKYFYLNFQKRKLNKKFKLKEITSQLICMLIYLQRHYFNIALNTKKYISENKSLAFDIINKNFNSYTPNEKLKEDGEKILKKYNIKIKEEFILLHARDSSFKPYENDDYRNTDINTFSLLVDYLFKKGYSVIRCGHSRMKKSSFEDKIIDITQMKILDEDKEILDVYFSAYCSYLVGSCSGFSALAAMFGKKTLSTNMAPFTHSLSINPGLSIPKLFKCKKTNKFLMFNEIFSSRVHNFFHSNFYDENNIELVDNSEEEILNAFKDLENNYLNKSEDELQNKFRNLFKKNTEFDYCYYSNSSISPSFIKKYFNLL